MTISIERVIDPAVISGIAKAAHSQNTDFAFLMAQASRESNFNPKAKAPNSSAAGLYQFIEQTWLGVLKAHGEEIGQGELASQIQTRSNGRHYVKDPALRKQILELRKDPAVSAQLAGAHAGDNKEWLEKKLGRTVNSTDLYLAHFLGPGGAAKFLSQIHDGKGGRDASSVFPLEAQNNPGIFFDKAGKPKALKQIYASLDKALTKDMQRYAQLAPTEGGGSLSAAPPNILADNSGPKPLTLAERAMDSKVWAQIHAGRAEDRTLLKALDLASAPYLS